MIIVLQVEMKWSRICEGPELLRSSVIVLLRSLLFGRKASLQEKQAKLLPNALLKQIRTYFTLQRGEELVLVTTRGRNLIAVEL